MASYKDVLVSRFVPLLMVAVCLVIAKVVTVMPHAIPLIILLGMTMAALAIVSFEWGLLILIYAMLLSPEFSLGAVGKRDIVVRVEDLMIIVFFLVWVARAAVHKGMRVITRTPLNRFIGGYCIIFIWSTMYGVLLGNVVPMKGIFYVLKYIEYFLIFYLVAGLLHDKRQVKTFLKALLITFAIVNVYACIQIGVADRVSAPFEGSGEPNTLGGYQVLMFGIILGVLSHVKSSRWQWPLVALGLFSMIPFLNTLSRASYLAFIPMYLTIIVFNRFKSRNILIGLLMIVMILSLFFLPQKVKDRITSTFVAEEQETINPVRIGGITFGPSASARLRDWEEVFQDWRRRPFVGYGVTGLRFLDGQFIATLAEVGLIGFTIFLGLLVSIFRNTLKIYKQSRDDLMKGLALGFLAGHVGMVVHALTANTFILIRIMEPYWFIAAMVMMIPVLEAKTSAKPPEPTPHDKDHLINTRLLLDARSM